MEKKFKFGVIGAGFMAKAIVNGVITSNLLSPSEIIMSDVNSSALCEVEGWGVNSTTDNFSLAENSEFVLFAVKPQSLSDVLLSLKGAKISKVITIMAGIKKDKIACNFNNISVARYMPNTPCSLGFGAIGLDVSDFSEKSDVDFIKALFSSLGTVVLLSENKLNAVTGVSGSSPAYFYLFLKSVIDAGVKVGLTYEESKKLAVSTMIGSGKMVEKNSDKSIDDLITAVCSKGGTTIEAVKVLKDGKIDEIVENAVKACVKRSFELENL